MSDIAALIERVERATGEEDLELSVAILHALDIASYITDDGDPLTSIDAALALVERVLPGWTAWEIRSRARKTLFVAEISRLTGPLSEHSNEELVSGHASTPSLAVLVALLRAVQEQERADAD